MEALCQEKGISLPADMMQIAAQYGLRLSAFQAYAGLQVGQWGGRVARHFVP